MCRDLQETPILGDFSDDVTYLFAVDCRPFEVELHRSRRLWPVVLVVFKLVSIHCDTDHILVAIHFYRVEPAATSWPELQENPTDKGL